MNTKLDIWNCRQCGDKMDNLTQRCQKRDTCDYCVIENRKLRNRITYHQRRVRNAS